MKYRTGGRRYPSEEEKLVQLYEPGDIVCNLLHGDSNVFKGVVIKSDIVTRKIWVKWGAGEIQQHTADEIILFLRRLDRSEYQQFSEHALKDFNSKDGYFRRGDDTSNQNSRRGGNSDLYQGVVHKLANGMTFLNGLKKAEDIEEIYMAGALEEAEVDKINKETFEGILAKYNEGIVPAIESIKEMVKLVQDIPALKPEYKIFTNALKVIGKTELKDFMEGE